MQSPRRSSMESLSPDRTSPNRMLDALDERCKMRNRKKLEHCLGMDRCHKGGMGNDMMDGHYWSQGWGWLAMLLLWFIIVTIFAWLIFYSLRPSYVKNPDTGELDTSKLLLASVIVGVIFIVVVWLLFCFCSGKFCSGGADGC